MRPQAVLFDLDGTLLDTAPDLAAALNRLRAEAALAPLPYTAIRPWVSHGSHALTRLAFDEAQDGALFETRRLRLLEVYHERIADLTRLFPGMDDVLDRLEGRGLRWGIVTNKPGWLTQPLLRALALDARAACVIAGDTLPERKPHPAPLLAAAQALELGPADCLYVGDAENDARAAIAAGMPVLIARYGYLTPHDAPQNWGSAGLLDGPLDLLAWL